MIVSNVRVSERGEIHMDVDWGRVEPGTTPEHLAKLVAELIGDATLAEGATDEERRLLRIAQGVHRPGEVSIVARTPPVVPTKLMIDLVRGEDADA